MITVFKCKKEVLYVLSLPKFIVGDLSKSPYVKEVRFFSKKAVVCLHRFGITQVPVIYCPSVMPHLKYAREDVIKNWILGIIVDIWPIAVKYLPRKLCVLAHELDWSNANVIRYPVGYSMRTNSEKLKLISLTRKISNMNEYAIKNYVYYTYLRITGTGELSKFK